MSVFTDRFSDLSFSQKQKKELLLHKKSDQICKVKTYRLLLHLKWRENSKSVGSKFSKNGGKMQKIADGAKNLQSHGGKNSENGGNIQN